MDITKETIKINKIICEKKEQIVVQGDMIVPDSKPDILNTINTDGNICIYKKEVFEGKLRLEGNIVSYIMYLADGEKNNLRGLNTTLDFSETIVVPELQIGMIVDIEPNIKNFDCKVINGRKIGIKAAIEVEIKIYSNEDVEIVNNIENADGIQMLKEDLKVNSLVGSGDTKIYAKDTISIDNVDNLAEILKANICICDKDIKISYNKILTKAEAEIKIMYLTEDDRINIVNARIPVVGFIDIQNVTEENICDVDYEIKNIVLKPNSQEEHSIYVEIEIGVFAIVYEEKQINLIQDLYSPSENLELNQKKITTMTKKTRTEETKQIRERVQVEGLQGNRILDVDAMPIIEKETRSKNRIVYEGEIELRFLISNNEQMIDTRTAKVPFDYEIANLEDGEHTNSNTQIEIANKDFVIQDGGIVDSNLDMKIGTNTYQNANINVIDEIQTNGEREKEDYSIIMYIVKKDDTLWKIAKMFGSTIEDIARVNGIEDENKIMPGQKLFIPHYTKIPMVTVNE